MNNIKKLTQKDRHGNMISFEFDVPPMESIPHPGQPMGTDTVPAWLTPGERVMNAEAERMYGPMLYQMNEQGRAVQRAQGGTIPEYAACGSKVKYKAQGGPVYAAEGTPVTQGEGFIPFDQMPGFAHIKSPEAEGFRPDVYDDPIKGSAVPTVGYGHKLLPEEIEAVRKGKKYTKEELEQMYLQDFLRAQQDARENIPGFNQMTPEMQGAFTSQAFQLGGQGQADFDQMIAAIDAGDKGTAIQEVYNSDWAKQTPKRAEYLANAIQEGSLQQAKSAVEGEMLASSVPEANRMIPTGYLNTDIFDKGGKFAPSAIPPLPQSGPIKPETAMERRARVMKDADEQFADAQKIRQGTYKEPSVAGGRGNVVEQAGERANALRSTSVDPYMMEDVPPSVDVEAPPKPLTGLEGVGIEQPEDDRGQAYGDGLKVQLGAVEQQLINLQEEAKNPRKAAELISSITELRNQRNRLADMYDEWAATQGTKQALGYGTEQAVPSYTQDDIELQSPRGTLEERRERQLIAEDVPKPVEVPEPIAQGLEQTETGKQIKEEAKVAQKEQATTSIVQQTEKEDSPAKTNTPPETVEQKGKEVGETNPDAKSTAENFFEEFGLSDLFDKKEIGRMVAMYLGSRALGYSHGGSLNFAAKNYAQRLDTKSKTEAAQKAKLNEQAFQLAKEGKHSSKSIENYRRTGNLAYLDLGTSQGVGKGEYKEFFREGKKYRAQEIAMPDGSVQYRTDQGLTIDGSFNDDAAFHKGTPEYDKRRETANNNNVAIFEEAFEMSGGKDSDTNDWTERLKVGPQKAAREFWAWAESARLDPNSNDARRIMGTAYQQALQDAKDGKVIIPSLEPYLKSQLFRETTGTTDMWLLNPEEVADGKQMPKYVRQDQMNVLLDNVERVASKKLPNSSLTTAKKTIFDQAMNSWANLPDAERQSWLDSTEKEAGVTGFYLFINDELQKAYSN